MTFAEAEEYIEGMDAYRREEWERTRSMVYAVFQSQIRQAIDPRDVMPLPWDKPHTTAIDDSEQARTALEGRAKAMELQLKKQTNG